MRLLILGGTAWLGRSLAAAGVALGHEVVCCARGVSGPVAAGARLVTMDRTEADAYAQVVAGRWDAVVDVSRQPGQVRSAARALRDVCDHCIFVSTVSVYRDHGARARDETAALLASLASDVMSSADDYGQAKVACEAHVLDAFGPSRCAVVRPGLIGGPGDVSDRTGYYALRLARPGNPEREVLAPDAAEQPTQMIDVRDLAEWILVVAAQRIAGIFNAAGDTTALHDHLQVAAAVAGAGSRLVMAAPAWLASREVGAWAGPKSLPLWLPTEDLHGLMDVSHAAASSAGLALRPLEQTLRDTLAWELGRSPGLQRRAGLTPDDEAGLLRQWKDNGPRAAAVGVHAT